MKQSNFHHTSNLGSDEIMEINELINLLINIGFAVALATYLLIRLEKSF